MKNKFLLLLFTPLFLFASDVGNKNYAKEFAYSLFYDFYPDAFSTLQEWEQKEELEETLPFLAYLLYEAQKPSILSFPQVSQAVRLSPEGSKARRIMKEVYLYFDEELCSPEYDGQCEGWPPKMPLVDLL